MDNFKNGDVQDKTKVINNDDAARQASKNLLEDVGGARQAAARDNDNVLQLAAAGKNVAKPAQNFNPSGYSVIPPYVLQELSRLEPHNRSHKDTFDKTKDLNDTSSAFRPHAAGGNDSAREVYDAKGKEVSPGDKARFEGDKPTGNDEVDKAYDYTGFVRDFYKKEYGRDSIDGQGMKFISTVNYGDNYENAFWNGSQMTYGHPGADSPFKTFVLLDVCGHEITHGVTEKESGMKYYGQSGALNESMSDVFGVLINQYAKGQTADKADWLVGAGIWKDGINGRGLRDMLNPGTAYDDPKVGKDPQPAHMKDYNKTWGDNGGVHYNSGIPNKAFATFAKAVGGNAWEDPGHIWYNARKASGDNPSFAQFAFHTIEEAKKLNHGDQVAKLEKAWADVGVTPSATTLDVDTPGVKAPTGPADKRQPSHPLKKAG